MKSAENVREQLKRTMERLNLQLATGFRPFSLELRRESLGWTHFPCVFSWLARPMLSTDFRDKDYYPNIRRSAF